MKVIYVSEDEDSMDGYWQCVFCGTYNLGTESRCKKCAGVRTVA